MKLEMTFVPKPERRERNLVSETCSVKREKFRSLGEERREMVEREDKRQNLYNKSKIIRFGEEFRKEYKTRGSSASEGVRI